jgi:hypothetical protein
VIPPGSDEALSRRQAALHAEAAEVLSELDLAATLAETGTMLLTGSYVSHLMCWPEVDVMVHAGARFTPDDVLRLLQRIVAHPAIVGFDYRDERGPRSPTGTTRDERYHVPVAVNLDDRSWRIDLTLWLNDPHSNLVTWHETLRDTITADQRSAVLRIKDVWHTVPSYPDQVGGLQIYTAVLDDGVRTPSQFAAWLVAHGYPDQ